MGAPVMTYSAWQVWNNLKSREAWQDDDGVPGHRPNYRFGRPPGPYSTDKRMGRVERVRAALDKSRSDAMGRIAAALKGIEVTAILTTLMNAVIEIATILGGSAITGAVVGGLVGSLAGGVGAAPGAAIGAAAGGQVGAWILGFLGLKSLAEDLSEAIPKAYASYQEGFSEAWGPPARWDRHEPPPRDDWFLVAGASRHFADGHVILLTTLLSAMAAYLTRGKGDRGVLIQEIRQSSRLGPRVADWVVANEEKLRNHPALKAKERPTASAMVHEKPLPDPETPSRVHRREKEAEHKPPAPMDKAKVPCFKADNLPQGSVPEFDRQLAGQEKGLNDLTVEEYMQGREAYKNRDPAIARQARADYHEELQQQHATEFRKQGMSAHEAERKATEIASEKMKTLAALHNPDLIAGGKDAIGDFGDKRVNSSIGAQWGSRVGKLDEASAKISPEHRAQVKMNADLKRCK
jgi:hypothetical protein